MSQEKSKELGYYMRIESQQIPIPEKLKSLQDITSYFKKMDPKLQIRFSGGNYKPFPFEKRLPYLEVNLDSNDEVINSTLHYIN